MKKPLTESENQSLLLRMIAGDKTARTDLIEGNYPLVFWVAARLARRMPNRSDLKTELVGEGSIALIEAIDSLPNYRGESAIATFLRRCLEYRMGNFIDRDGPITVPDRTQRQRRKSGNPIKKAGRSSLRALNNLVAPDENSAFEMRDLIMSCAETDHQRDMLELLEGGYTIRDISQKLGMPFGSIFNFRNAIYQKVCEKAGLKEKASD